MDKILEDKINPEDKATIETMLRHFNEQFWIDMEKAYSSGALSGDERPVVVARCVMQITAERFYSSKRANSKKILSNLQHFI